MHNKYINILNSIHLQNANENISSDHIYLKEFSHTKTIFHSAIHFKFPCCTAILELCVCACVHVCMHACVRACCVGSGDGSSESVDECWQALVRIAPVSGNN